MPENDEQEGSPPLLPTASQSSAGSTKNTGGSDEQGPAVENKHQHSQSGFISASSLLNRLNQSSPHYRERSPVPTRVHESFTDARSLPDEKNPPSSQPRSSSLARIPPQSQPSTSASETGKSLSRQSTESILELASSTSLSASSSFSSSLGFDGDENDGQEILNRILKAVMEMAEECRVCWVNKVVTRPHRTYHCPGGMLLDRDWQTFKLELRFPPKVLCYFCLAPYGPPFNHPQAPPGFKQGPEVCEFPDAMKELAYIVYKKQSLCEKVFGKLGANVPINVSVYKRYITRRHDGPLLGVYKVIDAYLRIREEGQSASE